VIFASSFLGVSVQKVSEKSHKLTNFLEYLSPVVMFLLGVLLFLNAQMV
jgi:EamA domain-containing membrane protein RarD